jgi:hypothetical protein
MLFTFRMALPSGEPADPPKRETSVSNWRPRDLFARVAVVRHPASGARERRPATLVGRSARPLVNCP